MITTTYLYVPGNKLEFVKKGIEKGADKIIIDLEDSIPISRKDEVRTEDGDMGEKKGDPIMQQLDVAKLVPLVTAALQELITRVEKLEAA